MAPKRFIAIYECVECGDEQYEMENCYVPYIRLYCDTCHEVTHFTSIKMVHRSFDWDYVEEDED